MLNSCDQLEGVPGDDPVVRFGGRDQQWGMGDPGFHVVAKPIKASAISRASAGRFLLVRIAKHFGDLEPDLEVGVFCQ